MNLFTISFTNHRHLSGQDFEENSLGTCILRVTADGLDEPVEAIELGDLVREPMMTMTQLLNALSDGRPKCKFVHEDDEYENECVLITNGGKQLRFTAAGELADYVRVCDSRGNELYYWVCDEWEECPDEVMGALLGALA